MLQSSWLSERFQDYHRQGLRRARHAFELFCPRPLPNAAFGCSFVFLDRRCALETLLAHQLHIPIVDSKLARILPRVQDSLQLDELPFLATKPLQVFFAALRLLP